MSVQTSEEAQLATTKRRARFEALLGLTLVALLALMWIVLAFNTRAFLTYGNISNLLRQGTVVAILAIGETFVIITAGIDLSVGAVTGFSTVIIALLLGSNVPVWACHPHHPGRWDGYRGFPRVRHYEARPAPIYYDAGDAHRHP